MPEQSHLTVAIDGPAGAGKSTVARKVADALGYTYIDSGAMYRAVAWKSLAEGIPPDEENAVVEIAESIEIDFRRERGDQRVIADGLDITRMIRSQEVSHLASVASAIPGVRHAMVAAQQAMGRGGGVVMEGRDIGTVVFPGAEVKIFLTASSGERARRRYEELKGKGTEADLERIRAEMEERDLRDSTRAMSPLKPAPDAVPLDTDGLTAGQVAERILDLCRSRGA